MYKFKSTNGTTGPIRVNKNLLSLDKEFVNIYIDYFASVFTEEIFVNFLKNNSYGKHAKNRLREFEVDAKVKKF